MVGGDVKSIYSHMVPLLSKVVCAVATWPACKDAAKANVLKMLGIVSTLWEQQMQKKTSERVASKTGMLRRIVRRQPAKVVVL